MGGVRVFSAVVLAWVMAVPASMGTAASTFPPGWVAHDDVVEMVGPWKPTGERPARGEQLDEDCRKKIPKVLCLVDGSHGANLMDRPCLDGTENYVAPFERLYDRVPQSMQRMFCSLERVFIEKDLPSTAYALRGAPIIGIRSSLIDKKLSLHAWASWKEQLSFGGTNLKEYPTKQGQPVYDGENPDGEDNFLYSVIIHEFGHLLDFANDVNDSEGWAGDLKADTYGSLSWKSIYQPKAESEFPHRKGLCVYRCGGRFLPLTAVEPLYEGLYTKSNFLNTYTSKSAYEDFADTFSFYLLFSQSRISYRLNTAQGKSYDLREALASERLRPKAQWIENFLARPDIKYP